MCARNKLQQGYCVTVSMFFHYSGESTLMHILFLLCLLLVKCLILKWLCG